ncbi:MAG: J domain-containing protein, partial [Verrucomicrobiota bacterium]
MRKNPLEYYRILGLPPGSGAAELKRAYRQLIQRWHPDHFKSRSLMQTTAEDLTKEINEAYEQLYKKQLYKRFLTKTAPRSAAPFTPARPTRPAAGEPAPPRAKRRPVDPAPPAPPRRKTRWRPRRGTWIRVGVGLTLIAALFAARSCEPEFIADLRAVIHAVANAPAPARPEPGPAPATPRAVP